MVRFSHMCQRPKHILDRHLFQAQCNSTSGEFGLTIGTGIEFCKMRAGPWRLCSQLEPDQNPLAGARTQRLIDAFVFGLTFRFGNRGKMRMVLAIHRFMLAYAARYALQNRATVCQNVSMPHS